MIPDEPPLRGHDPDEPPLRGDEGDQILQALRRAARAYHAQQVRIYLAAYTLDGDPRHVLQACSIARAAGFSIVPRTLALERECLIHVQQERRKRGRPKDTVRDLDRLVQALRCAEWEASQVPKSQRFLRDLNRLRKQGLIRSGKGYGGASEQQLLEWEDVALRMVAAAKQRRRRRGAVQSNQLGKIASQMFPVTAATFRKTLQQLRRKRLSF